jgi:hypothetical protein
MRPARQVMSTDEVSCGLVQVLYHVFTDFLTARGETSTLNSRHRLQHAVMSHGLIC